MTYGFPDSITVGTIRRLSRRSGPGFSSFSGTRGPRAGSFGYSVVFKKLVFYPGALDFYLDSPSGQVGSYLKKRGRKIVVASKRQVGVKTGLLKASINMRHLRDGIGQYLWIGSRVPHALLHHEGTKPHVIVPRTAPILRFVSGTRLVFTKEVNHPGTRPNRYLSNQLYLVKT